MVGLQIKALKKKTLTNKLMEYAKERKKIEGKKVLSSKKSSKNTLENSALPYLFNVFTFFKEDPQKLIDFPVPNSFVQTNQNKSYRTIQKKDSARRKKINHHEETYPLFSRI